MREAGSPQQRQALYPVLGVSASALSLLASSFLGYRQVLAAGAGLRACNWSLDQRLRLIYWVESGE